MKQNTSTEKNGSIDYLRFVAAIGIVWFHTSAPGKVLAYSALPCFIAILALYGTRPGSLAEAVHRRSARLLKPWLGWSLIYAAARTALSLKHGEPPLGWFEWPMLTYGTWIHLWFLPFAFFSGVLLAPILRLTERNLLLRNLVLLGLLGLSLALVLLAPKYAATPLPQWTFGAGTLGICLPMFFAVGSRIVRSTLYFSSGMATLAWYVLVSNSEGIAVGLGVIAVLVANKARLPSSPISAICSKLAVQIYLVHPILIYFGHWLGLKGTPLGLQSACSSVIMAALIVAMHSKGKAIFGRQSN